MAEKGIEMLKLAGPIVAILGAGALLIKKSVYTVDGGHRAIKFSRFVGVRPTAYHEGWHLRIPYFERPIIYDVRSHFVNTNATTGSKDLQTVKLTVRVLFRPMENDLPKLYRFVGKDYTQRVLPSLINEITRIIVVSYTEKHRLVTLHLN